MGWFGRKKSKDAEPPAYLGAIDDFWEWWPSVAGTFSQDLASGNFERHIDEISRRVHAIDAGLQWELSAGAPGGHRLVVTAAGDPELRRIARRWLRAAPEGDGIWSFGDFRSPSAIAGEMQIGDARIDVGGLRVAVQRAGSGIDVVMYHPDFGAIPDDLRGSITFVNLDAALGEEAVETWVSRVEWTAEEPAETIRLAELPEAVDEVSQEFAPDGEMGWSLLQAQSPDGPLLVTCMNRLSSVQAPDFDLYVRVGVGFRDVTENGWPGDGSFELITQFEDHLSEIVRGSGMLVAVDSCAGVRTLHYYVDSTTPAVEQLRAASTGWTQGRVTIDSTLDPSWESVAMFRQ